MQTVKGLLFFRFSAPSEPAFSRRLSQTGRVYFSSSLFPKRIKQAVYGHKPPILSKILILKDFILVRAGCQSFSAIVHLFFKSDKLTQPDSLLSDHGRLRTIIQPDKTTASTIPPRSSTSLIFASVCAACRQQVINQDDFLSGDESHPYGFRELHCRIQGHTL